MLPTLQITHPFLPGCQPLVWRLFSWFLAALLLSSQLPAQPVLVKDINLKSYMGGRFPQNLKNVNGTLFYLGYDITSGYELWKSDGTPQGTGMVKDINPGSGNSLDYASTFFTDVNGTLFFRANDGTNGPELWKSDGTDAGTVLVRDIIPGAGGSYPADLMDVNGTLFFTAGTITDSYGLWKSDGTAAGTVMVKNFLAGPNSPRIGDLVTAGGTLYFTQLGNGSNNAGLWKSDGTEEGTVMVDPFTGFNVNLVNSASVNSILFFTVNSEGGAELWKSDGTPAGTVIVKAVYAAGLTNANGTLFFLASSGSLSSSELWKSDGTTQGTVRVKAIGQDPSVSVPGSLTNVNGTLFFVASDNLWKSDGTSAGTFRLNDIYSSDLTNVNGVLFFRASTEAHGTELWKSDGTSAGTVMVKDIEPSYGNSFPENLTDVNGTLFLTADDGIHGKELWKSGGTAEGTVMVKDAYVGNDGSFSNPFDNPYTGELTDVNGTLFFIANNETSGDEVWKSDGTAQGTVLVKDVEPGPSGSGPGELTNVNGTLFFAALNSLWRSDGTPAGTLRLNNIYSSDLTNVNGVLFFRASTEANGYELWKSDGTAEGTVLVKDINPSSSASNPANFINVNGTLFFIASNGTNGREIWKSDGTSEGTVMVKDIAPGSENFEPSVWANVNGTLFFPADYALWKSDGTAAGTVIVRQFDPGAGVSSIGISSTSIINSTLLFVVDKGMNGSELWKSDGTNAGTVMLATVRGVDLEGSVNIDGTLYFRAYNQSNGSELWKSDGTAAGTVMVKDINPGTEHSFATGLTNVNNTLVFRATNGEDGWELWRSDGTAAGTAMVQDILPGSRSSIPFYLTEVNGTLFFTAQDGLRGRELWKYTPLGGPTPTAFRINAGGGAYSSSRGEAFAADQYAKGGSLTNPVRAAIAHTEDDTLYQQARYGERFTYSLPTGNGVYYVVLHFAETYWGNLAEGGQGSRRFNVDIEELRKLTDYDIYSKAGGSLRAVQEAFRVVVKDGILAIRFSKGSADLPLISAIEVFPEDAFRINVAGSAYLSSKGWFLSDAYYGGGSVSAYAPGAVAGTEDDELYRSNRHSSLFHYNLPTGPGQFQVTLHFAETYWGNQVQGGAGSRRFNVNAEGERKLSGYDTYQRAGGAMQAQQEQFSVTVTDQVLSLAFLRGSSDNSVDFAHVAAIEVVRQGDANAHLASEGKAPETFGVVLYPNPAFTLLTIGLAEASKIKATSIRDATGRALLINAHQTVDQHRLQVDITSLKPGLYMMQVQFSKENMVIKFLKR
jgi:ELWxxDGT repeat protein